jgi:ADP-dependent NAD(P)H-hydrate dehydratase
MSQIIDLPLLKRIQKPALGSDADKDGRGRVLVIGASQDVPGAVLLTGTAALRSGAGKLQLAVAAEAAVVLGAAMPEARIIRIAGGDVAAVAEHAARNDAVVVGPGMMEEETARRLTRALGAARGEASFVFDAAAMTSLAPEEGRAFGGRLVLTPHAGEMAALSGRDKDEVLDEPLEIAREVSAAYQAVVIMKGRDSHVVSPDGRAWQHVGGVVGLATSGSGDVLAGVVGGLLARGFSPVDAAIIGVYLHGRAGWRLSHEVGPLGFLARELPGEIPQIMAEIGAS